MNHWAVAAFYRQASKGAFQWEPIHVPTPFRTRGPTRTRGLFRTRLGPFRDSDRRFAEGRP
jgi:hypothetical protein